MLSISLLKPVVYRLPVALQRGFAVTGRHSKNVQGKKNKLDLMKLKLYDKLSKRIIMVELSC